MSIHAVPEPEDNFRLVPFDVPGRDNIFTTRRDFVEPVPIGTFVAMVFRVTGYDRDCDGSAMARLEQVDRHGEDSGWTPTHLGLRADYDVVLDGPGDLHDLIAPDD